MAMASTVPSASATKLPNNPFQVGPTLPIVEPSMEWHATQPIKSEIRLPSSAVTGVAAPAPVPPSNGHARGTPLNRSIERAARLLGLFSQEHPELSLAEITTRLEATKATTHRYTMALRRAGLLRYDTGRQVYSLGPRIVELAASALVGPRIVRVAGPHMDRLVAAVNETVVLSVWDGEAPVVMRVEDNTDRIARIVVRTGTRLPPDSAQGKVFEAFSQAEASTATTAG